jgi:hypothetical protein
MNSYENKKNLQALGVAFEVLECLGGFEDNLANADDFAYNLVVAPDDNFLFVDEFVDAYMLYLWPKIDFFDRKLLIKVTKILDVDGGLIDAGCSWEAVGHKKEFIRRLRVCYLRALKIRSDCIKAGYELLKGQAVAA